MGENGKGQSQDAASDDEEYFEPDEEELEEERELYTAVTLTSVYSKP